MFRNIQFYLLLVALLPGFSCWAIATADNAASADDPASHGYSLNWGYIYKCNGSSSVAVDHYWVLTAAHVADDGVGTLAVGGETYTRQEVVYHPTADLALERYDKPFPGYYSLHDGLVHNGKNGPQRVWDTLIMSGYGRTGTVTVATFTNGPGGNGTKRWGTNKGDGYSAPTVNMGGTVGNRTTQCFSTSFNLADTPYEAGAAQYDSGGPVFIERAGEWKIAGLSILLTGASPLFTGNLMVDVATYRTWIMENIPDYDTDMDGLPDWWELQYGIDETSMVATNDIDGDQFTNYEEWIGDTDPTDIDSFLSLGPYTNAAEVVFIGSSNREYQIQYRLDLTDTNETWATEVDWFSGSGPAQAEAVSTGSSNRFYRLRARLP